MELLAEADAMESSRAIIVWLFLKLLARMKKL
jgi:hypothetical protein